MVDKKNQDKKDKDKKKIEKEESPLNSSVNSSISRLNKEDKRAKGNLDKIQKKQITSSVGHINSPIVLKRNCARLMNFLHQTMHHTTAIKVNDVSKLIKDKMSRRDMQKIIDTMDDIGKKHGFDFFKP